MSKFLFALGFLIAVSNIKGQSIVQIADTSIAEFDFSILNLKKLPLPNSGTLCIEEVEQEKNEIYNLQLTPKHFSWKNPTTGGAVHISKKDEVEVYQFTFGIFQHRNDTAVFFSEAARGTFIVLKDTKDLLSHVSGIGFGNPTSVLITSEIPLDKSEAIKKVMEELWGRVEIYYLTTTR